MSLLDRNVSIRINDVQHLFFEKSSVLVAPRPYHALSFRVTGRAVFTHGGAAFGAGPGSVTYIPANCRYAAEYTEKNEIIAIHFYADAELGVEVYDLFSSRAAPELFKSAYSIWRDAQQAYYYRAMSVFYEILANVSERADLFRARESYKDFYEAVEYMKKNYADCDLSVGRLARIANMSDTYFRKLFFDRFGENPSKYINGLRLSRAEKLLSRGDMTVNEVALASGFGDPKYFSRAVKKAYGCPPSDIFIHKSGARRS